MGRRDPLIDAVELVVRFRADMADETITLVEVAERWGVSDTTLRVLARRLGLPPRRRGRKKVDRAVPSSPQKLSGGRWVIHGGIRRWVA
jgi:hypothetical protein